MLKRCLMSHINYTFCYKLILIFLSNMITKQLLQSRNITFIQSPQTVYFSVCIYIHNVFLILQRLYVMYSVLFNNKIKFGNYLTVLRDYQKDKLERINFSVSNLVFLEILYKINQSLLTESVCKLKLKINCIHYPPIQTKQ